MSYGIVRVQKMTSGSVKGIEIHDRREKDGISHTNKDIDWSKTKDNYNLHPETGKSFYMSVKDRISELNLPKAVRKDAIVMAQVLVTSDRGFFDNLTPDRQKEFFKDSYEFVKARYGAENIISATVHMDENTPHMHVNFVLVTDDGRLSAKTLLTPITLREQHDRFYKDVGKAYGLDRGEQGGKAKHYEVAEYKAMTAAQDAESVARDAMQEAARIAQETRNAQEVSRNIQEQIKRSQDTLNALQDDCKGLLTRKEKLEAAVLPIPALQAIQPQKTLGGALKGVTEEDIVRLKASAMAANSLKLENINLKKENSDLKKMVPTMENRMQIAKEKAELQNLRRENSAMKELIDRYELNQELKKMLNPIQRGFEHER